MLLKRIKNLSDVLKWRLCMGCGTCASVCENITLFNVLDEGIRPRINLHKCIGCNECLLNCPGYSVDGNAISGNILNKTEAKFEFGQTLEIWEGYALDPEIRLKASSGGILTALSLYCIEKEGIKLIVHTGMDEKHPWLNETKLSRTKEELLASTGSRYSPASPCDSLNKIEQSKGSCVFIGKPCDVTGVSLLRKKRKKLDDNIGLVLTFFCAGTPSTLGTFNLLEKLHISYKNLSLLRYRGEGWPGTFKAIYGNEKEEQVLSYEESWSELTRYRTLRCKICPDGLGRLADISCGDAWHIYGASKDEGRSIVLVRTKRGQTILQRAMEHGYVHLNKISERNVFEAQQNLLERRKQLFGRMIAFKILGIPFPKYNGFSLYDSWKRLSSSAKIKSILGTFKRIIYRSYWKQHFINWENIIN